MVIPVGGAGAGAEWDTQAPTVVKEHYAKYWWMYFVWLILVCVGKLVATDILGGFNTAIMVFIIWYTVKNQCANMTQCCVFVIGLMCSMNAIFELIFLFVQVGGREERTTSCIEGSSGSICTTVIEEHDFFDGSQGSIYILQSIMLIVSPVTQLMGAALGYKTYEQYPRSLFGNDEEQPLRGRNGADGGGGGGGGNIFGGDPPVFQGTGQRLGSP